MYFTDPYDRTLTAIDYDYWNYLDEQSDYENEKEDFEYGMNPDNLQWIPPDLVEDTIVIWNIDE